MGNRFNLDKSLASLDKLIRRGRALDPAELRARDPHEGAYGEGVTRQWIHRTGRTLLLSPLLFLESDSFPRIASDVSQQKKKWKFKSVGLVVMALSKFQVNLGNNSFATSTANLERSMSISPLSQPKAGSAAEKQLVGAGRLLAMSLVRKEPLGVLVSAPTCKLLLGGAESISWEDLAAVLPAKRFGAVLSCMADDISEAERQSRLDVFKLNVLGLIEGDPDPVFEVESRASRRYALATKRRETLQGISDDASSIEGLQAAVTVAVGALDAAQAELDNFCARASGSAAGAGTRTANRFGQCMRAVSALSPSPSPVDAAKFALEWMAAQPKPSADHAGGVGSTSKQLLAARETAVTLANENVEDAKAALQHVMSRAGPAAVAAPEVAAAAAAAAAAEVPRAPSRFDSAIDDGLEEMVVDPSNVGDYIRGWTQKELVVNTTSQISLMLKGVSEIQGGREVLRKLSRGHQSPGDGWRALQQAIRGAVELDVNEWRAKTVS